MLVHFTVLYMITNINILEQQLQCAILQWQKKKGKEGNVKLQQNKSFCDKSMAAHMNGGLRGKEMEGENSYYVERQGHKKNVLCKGKRLATRVESTQST